MTNDQTNILETALANSSVFKDESGYYFEIYADYRDEFEDKSITKILESNDPYEAFYEKLMEGYVEAEDEGYHEIIESIIESLKDEDDELPADLDEDIIGDYIRENVYCKYPEDHYLNQDVYVNIFLDTGDGNYDYVLNCIYPHYNGTCGEPIDNKASIAWLAKQQGYKKSVLKHALYHGIEEEGFLKSIRTEILNHGSHMGCIAFLVRMSFKDLIYLNNLIKLQDVNGHKYDATKNPYCGYIMIDKSCITGIYDCWSGGGSLFEIELEKDVKLPIKYIRSALPDGGDGCSVESVYGMCGSAWRRDMVKQIHAPNKYRKEILQC